MAIAKADQECESSFAQRLARIPRCFFVNAPAISIEGTDGTLSLQSAIRSVAHHLNLIAIEVDSGAPRLKSLRENSVLRKGTGGTFT